MCYNFVGRDTVAMVIEEKATQYAHIFLRHYNISHFFIDSTHREGRDYVQNQYGPSTKERELPDQYCSQHQ